jgi:hypothetical protein
MKEQVKTKHTPGPWKVVDAHITKRGVRSKGYYICFMSDPTRFSNQEERYQEDLARREFDARLIAAAPELLEACKILVGFESGELTDSAIKAEEVMTRVKQAIAKAEGGES